MSGLWMRRIQLASVLVAAAGWAFPALAATLAAGAVSIQGPGEAAVPVTLARSPQEAVGGIQFDLTYSGEAFTVTAVVAGAALDNTGKTVQYTSLNSGSIRVIISGFNLNTIPSGVVAEVRLAPLSNALPGAYPIVLEEAILSTPYGDSIPTTVTAGSVTITGAISACDLNRDARLDAVDVQLVVNAALARDIGDIDADVQNDGRVDAYDVQVVVNAVLGLAR